MPELTASQTKLIQYLNEAYGKEKELETSLQAHIAMTTRPPYRKRLQDHLRETKAQSKGLERRIKKLGGTAETVSLPVPEAATGAAQAVQNVANRAAALAQGPLHAVRGTGEEERLLKNAKTEFSDEAEEIANYTAIETLAQTVGDKETVKLARDFRRQEERMAAFLTKLIPQLTNAVARAELPASERDGGRRRRSSRRRSASARSRSASSSRSSGSRRAASSRSSGSRRTASSRSSGSRRAASSRSSGSRARSSGSSRGSSSRGSTSRGSSSRGSTSRGSTSRGSSSRGSRSSGGSSSRGSRSSGSSRRSSGGGSR